jgi:hypothetical protein
MTDTLNAPRHSNGATRKTLASQLDRLDGILNTLDARLHDTIATAVEQAVGAAVHQAVKAVLTEVLTNADLQQQLQPATPPPDDRNGEPPNRLRTLWDGLCRKTKQGWGAVKRTWTKTATRVRVVLLTAAGAVATAVCLAPARVASAAVRVWGWTCGLAAGAGMILGRVLAPLTCGT